MTMTTQDLASLYERLLPYLDWQLDESVEQLRDRLTDVAKLLNDFSQEILPRKDAGL